MTKWCHSRSKVSWHRDLLVQDCSANPAHHLVVRTRDRLVQLLQLFAKLLLGFASKGRCDILVGQMNRKNRQAVEFEILLGDGQVDRDDLVDVEKDDKEWISRVSLLHRRVHGDLGA